MRQNVPATVQPTYSATVDRVVHFEKSAFGINFRFMGVSKVTLNNRQPKYIV